MHPISLYKHGTYAGFHLICCHLDHYTRARNAEKLCVIKYPELNKFCIPAKLTKLKLIEHFAHVTLITPKYSQSTVYSYIIILYYLT